MDKSFFYHPAVIGILIGLPGAAIAVFGLLVAIKKDKAIEKAGILTEKNSSIQQLIEGHNSLVKLLQEDNKTLREEVKKLTSEIRELKTEISVLNSKLKNGGVIT